MSFTLPFSQSTFSDLPFFYILPLVYIYTLIFWKKKKDSKRKKKKKRDKLAIWQLNIEKEKEEFYADKQ